MVSDQTKYQVSQRIVFFKTHFLNDSRIGVAVANHQAEAVARQVAQANGLVFDRKIADHDAGCTEMVGAGTDGVRRWVEIQA